MTTNFLLTQIRSVFHTLRRSCFLLLTGVATQAQAEQVDPDKIELQYSGLQGFSNMTSWLTEAIAFFQGPLAVAATVIAVILGILLWLFAPREGVIAILARVVLAGIAIMASTTWVVSFNSVV